MKAQKFWSLLILGTMSCLVGVAKPHTAEASLYPSVWIQQPALVVERRGYTGDVYCHAVPARFRPVFKDAFPIVALLQGGGVDKCFYRQFCRKLACFGFVVLIASAFPTFGP